MPRCPRAYEETITANMTVSEGQQAIVASEASLRAELTGAIAVAQIEIANAIAELARSGADNAALTNQSQALQQLQRTVGSANLGSLLAVRSEVAATASSATNLANQAIATATSAAAAQANLTPAERARANIEALSHDLFERKVLDPYLEFNSPEDEAAYRKREAERDEARKRALALGTPEGDRRATEIVRDQLLDAGAHGAYRSPDFAAMMLRANAATADLQPSPRTTEQSSNASEVQSAKGAERLVPDDGLGDILATLKAAGVTTSAMQASDAGHGVSLTIAQAREVTSPNRQG
jgi:hypothetical protein